MALITDRASLTSWLEQQPSDVQVAIAARGALRTLGGLGFARPGQFGDLALICLRTAMIACLSAHGQSVQLQSLASNLGGQTSRLATDATLPEFMAVRAVSSAALSSLVDGTEIPTASQPPTRWTITAGPTATTAAQAIAIVTNDREAPFQALMFGNASNDATLIATGLRPVHLLGKSLWSPAPPIERDVTGGIGRLFNCFAADPDTWHFWRDWYQGFLDGNPLDWELQRRVAWIPDEDWDKGPAHVAEVIDEIRARFEVERHAEAVVALLAAPDLLPAGIGHNNPPDAIANLPMNQADIAETDRMIARVMQEARAERPDKGVVAGALGWIRQALWKTTVWFARKADGAAEEFAKKFGGYCAAAALPATAWALGQMPRLLDALSELARSLETWLPFIK